MRCDVRIIASVSSAQTLLSSSDNFRRLVENELAGFRDEKLRDEKSRDEKLRDEKLRDEKLRDGKKLQGVGNE